jgi:ubiquinone/menaquinone biosynthesis C-methylase UbiE
MPDELPGFQTGGLTWQERAERCPGESAVYAPEDPHLSRWLALVTRVCLRETLGLLRPGGAALDFGCGTGEKTAILATKASKVTAVDITPGMLDRARARCAGLNVDVAQIDGVHIPLPDASVDLVWISGVLKYSLLVPEPRHREIVAELHRVLKPGGLVCNLEMHVREDASTFDADFRARGFEVQDRRPVHVYRSRAYSLALGRWHALFQRPYFARLSVAWSRRLSAERLGNSVRDYFFVYRRP